MLSEDEEKIISDKMGAKVHEMWAETRRKERGWHAPENCDYVDSGTLDPHRTGDCPNCHTCMRPYDELPEKETVLVRAYPKVFIEILDEMEYEVIPKDRLKRLLTAYSLVIQVLPDSIHEDDESWNHAWDELSDEAQEEVKKVRKRIVELTDPNK